MSKYSLFPITDHKAMSLYDELARTFWSHEDLDYSLDQSGYDILPEAIKESVDSILSFFAISDAVVNENLGVNFIDQAPNKELRRVYELQAGNESIHEFTYNLLIDAMILDPVYKTELQNALVNSAVIDKKVLFAEKYLKSEKMTKWEVLAFMCVEGIFFSSSFAFIYWLQDYFGNKTALTNSSMPAFFLSNEYIARDEHLHTKIGGHSLKVLGGIPEAELEKAHNIIRDAVETESVFVNAVIPDFDETLTKSNMREHVKVCADIVCDLANIPRIYNTNTKFKSVAGMALPTNNSFFERRNHSYELANNTGLHRLEEF